MLIADTQFPAIDHPQAIGVARWKKKPNSHTTAPTSTG